LSIPHINDSVALNRVADSKHVPIEEIVEDLEKRELILKWMVQNKLNTYEQVSDVIRKYYVSPQELFNRVRFVV
jgi:flagellar protein FlaI